MDVPMEDRLQVERERCCSLRQLNAVACYNLVPMSAKIQRRNIHPTHPSPLRSIQSVD